MAVSPQEVYTRNMQQLKLGYPLWIPEPSVELVAHREDGLRIGDVGCIVPKNGSFDVFFNISLPRNDPLHAHGVPDHFAPARIPAGAIVTISNTDQLDRITPSPSVKISEPPTGESGIVRADDPSRMSACFKIYSDEGAILILPDGADHQYLHDTSIFTDMARRDGVAWYDFARNHLGRLIPDNSLYLITGLFKAMSWSLASFTDAEAKSAQFTLKGAGGCSSYSWQSTGAKMDWRCERTKETTGIRNQTLFIQGLNIELTKTGFLGKKTIHVTLDPNTVDLKADLITLDKINPVSGGAFGDIYKGTYRARSGMLEVAIKVIKFYALEQENPAKIERRLRREIRVWSALDHDNILRLIGTTSMISSPFPALVSPWAENNTLTSYLEHKKGLTEAEAQEMTRDVASGLHYLHSKDIVHGDLSARNILIKANGRALLADFGLSAVLEELGESLFSTSRRGKGTFRWMAPELLGLQDPGNPKKLQPLKESDVYSFGCIMFQILSGEIPYGGLRDPQVILQMSKKISPKRPENPHLTDNRWNFIQRCWSPFDQVQLRPSSRDIVDFSENM